MCLGNYTSQVNFYLGWKPLASSCIYSDTLGLQTDRLQSPILPPSFPRAEPKAPYLPAQQVTRVSDGCLLADDRREALGLLWGHREGFQEKKTMWELECPWVGQVRKAGQLLCSLTSGGITLKRNLSLTGVPPTNLTDSSSSLSSGESQHKLVFPWVITQGLWGILSILRWKAQRCLERPCD